MRRVLRAMLMWSATCLLIACGGGNSGSSDTAPSARVSAAQSAPPGATVVLDGSTSSDPDGQPLVYSWALTKPAGSAAALSDATAATASFVPDVAGTYIAALTVNDGKQSSTITTVSVNVPPGEGLTIVADQGAPLSGLVHLALSAAIQDASISWYVDLSQIGTGETVSWDTATATSATHLVVARIQVAGGGVLEVRRTLAVAQSGISLTFNVSALPGAVYVDISAYSPNNILSVAASFDGMSLGALTALNACSGYCGGTLNVYRFTVDAYAAGSGEHTMLVIVTDGLGNTRQMSIPISVSNAPVISISGPLDGALVYGILQLSGAEFTDKSGPVTVTARLGDVQILQTTASTFSASYDLTGLLAGAYTLTVSATDATDAVTTVQRTVVVTSAEALAYQPVFALGAKGRMLAVEGDLLLYTAEDLSVRLRDTLAGTEVVLQDTGSLEYSSDWQISGGLVYAVADGTDCVANSSCIYQWHADGSRTNLTASNPWAGTTFQQHPVAHAGFVLWCNDAKGSGGSYTLYDAAHGSFTLVSAAAGVNSVGNNSYDFALVGGVVNFFYWAGVTNSSGISENAVFRWTSADRVSTRISTPGLSSIYPQTDGQRVAWTQNPGLDGHKAPLFTQSVAGGAITQPTAEANNFVLRDGVLVWLDSADGLKASTVNATSTVTKLSSSGFYGVGGGFAVYDELGSRTSSWNSVTGLSTLLLDARPRQVLINGNKMYFVLGEAQTLYELTLH